MQKTKEKGNLSAEPLESKEPCEITAKAIHVVELKPKGSAGDIVMTVKDSKKVALELTDVWIVSGSVTVDWGDGSPIVKHKLDEDEEYLELAKEYDNVGEYSITLNAKARWIDDLQSLVCSNNKITSIDVSKCKWLTGCLHCDDNNLTSLDISKAKISGLYCSDNQLTSLLLSEKCSLEVLHCSNNELTELKLHHQKKLEWVDIRNCKFQASALNELMQTLHGGGGKMTITGNPGADDCDRSIAEGKGWKFLKRVGDAFVPDI